jgi:hypothetical protein
MRANPAGIAYLYLASDIPTVIAEVRAVPGDYLSVGQFAVARDLNIIDLSVKLTELDPFLYPDLKSEIVRRGLLREFGNSLAKPVRDEDHEVDYVITQYLAEYILHNGYDGIAFRSSMANGSNLVLFEPSDAQCRHVELKYIQSARIQYKVKDLP